MDIYLVCDGGGSKTEFLLFDQVGNVLAVARGEGANANFLPPEAAIANVCGGIKTCLQNAGLSVGQLSGVWLFIPGFKSCLKEVQDFLGGVKVQLTSDEKNAFYAALGAPMGIAVLAGTGSFAIGRNRQGREAAAGGWGPAFGDEGSGYHIGTLCLAKLAWLHDRELLHGTLLEQMTLAALNAPDVLSLRRLACEPGFDRKKVASLCQVVGQAAREGDSDAHEILDVAARALAGLAGTVADTLQETELPVALAGGVARMGEFFEEKFRTALENRLPNCRWQRAYCEPVVGGALCLLSEIAGVRLTDGAVGQNLLRGKNG